MFNHPQTIPTANHSQKAEKYSVEWRKSTIEIAGIFGGVIGVAFLICQYHEMVNATNAALDSVKISRDQLEEMKRTNRVDERVWVAPFEMSLEHSVTGTNYFFLKLNFKNTARHQP
jgi:hypothetical protein